MTAKPVNPEIAKNAMITRIVNFFAKSASTADLADMLGDVTVAKGDPVASPLSEAIPDMFSGSKETSVPSAADLEIGGGVKAKGNQASEMISAYSPNQAPQKGTMADAVQLGQMIDCLESIRKAVNAQAQEHELVKAIVIRLAKAQPAAAAVAVAAAPVVKAEGEDKTEKKPDDEDDEVTKAIAGMIVKSQSWVDGARERIETAKAMRTEGFKSQAAQARLGAAELIVKARKLVEAAKALSPANAKVDALSKAVDGVAEDIVDGEEDETAKSAAAASVAPAVKSELAPALSPEILQRVESALDGIRIEKSTLHGLMDTLRGLPKEVAKGIPTLPVVAKSAVDLDETLRTSIRAKEESGELTYAEASAAMDLTALAKADRLGAAPKGLFDAKLAGMPSAVQSIFQNAAA